MEGEILLFSGVSLVENTVSLCKVGCGEIVSKIGGIKLLETPSNELQGLSNTI